MQLTLCVLHFILIGLQEVRVAPLPPCSRGHGRLWPNRLWPKRLWPIFRLWPIVVLTDFGQTDCFEVLTDFRQIDFGEFWCCSVLAKFSGVVVVLLLLLLLLCCCVRKFHSFFSIWGGGVFTFVHVWALRLSCETPAAPPQTCSNTTKIQREDTQRDTETAKRWREREEKERNFGPPHPSGPHTSGPPPFRGPHLSAPFQGPTLSGPHPFGAPPFRGPTLSGPHPFGAPPFRGPTLSGPHPFGAPPFRGPTLSGPTFSGPFWLKIFVRTFLC